MISKNKLKELAAYRQQKRCDEEAVFVVEGPKMAAEALASGFTIRTVCATAEWLAAEAANTVANDIYEVSPAELERLSNMKSPSLVWMLVERRTENGERRTENGKRRTENGERRTENGERRTENGKRRTENGERRTENGLVLALDRIQDPGNMGTLMRTADWFGIRQVVCSRDTVSCFNPKVVQASMGAIFRTEVDYVELPQWLAGCGRPVYGASLQGEPLAGRDARGPKDAVLLIGNESRGISPEAMALVTHPVLIPNLGGTAESLNAAVAAGILIYYLTQQ